LLFVLLNLIVDRDLAGIWNAAFEESPLRQFSGREPLEALWWLFRRNVTRQVEAASLATVQPVSPRQLRFTVETRRPW
jgi:hypothetical protein